MPEGLRVTGLDEAMKRLDVFDKKQFDKSAQKVLSAAARSLVAPIRAELDASVIGHGKVPGRLRASVKTRKGKASFGNLPAVVVRPTAPYRHLVIRGHEIVAHNTRGHLATSVFGRSQLVRSGRRTRANPFVDRGMAGQEARVKLFVTRQIERELKLK
jgi:Bacteriophage HK97-gp10, putative tail-component